jgi:hypothetical protein
MVADISVSCKIVGLLAYHPAYNFYSVGYISHGLNKSFQVVQSLQVRLF